jgi:hypothetical protein
VDVIDTSKVGCFRKGGRDADSGLAAEAAAGRVNWRFRLGGGAGLVAPTVTYDGDATFVLRSRLRKNGFEFSTGCCDKAAEVETFALVGSTALDLSLSSWTTCGTSLAVAGVHFVLAADTGDVTPLAVLRSRFGENIKFPVITVAVESDVSVSFGTSSGGASR